MEIVREADAVNKEDSPNGNEARRLSLDRNAFDRVRVTEKVNSDEPVGEIDGEN
jgi:hypothetical protein